MHDQVTFETRLADAYERYLAVMPVAIDPRAMAAQAAESGRSIRTGAPWFGRPRAERRLRLVLVAALTVGTIAAVALVGGASRPVVLPLVGTFTPGPGRTAVPMPGPLTSYEGRFVSGGSLDTTLATEFLIQLTDGRVLGIGDSWPERKQQSLWDPTTQQFGPAGLLTETRQQPVAVRLLDGRVLILGGNLTESTFVNGGYAGSATYSTAEIYDPRSGTFTPVGPMVGKGWAPTVVALADGRVLVMDGVSVDDVDTSEPELATAEIFDPATGGFVVTGSMAIPRGPHAAVLLGDGRVFVSGGRFPEPAVAELFDPTTGTFSQVAMPEAAPQPAGGRYWPTVAANVVPLSDGRLFIAGRRCQEVQSITANGNGEGWYPTDAAFFDPFTDTFTPTEPIPHCVDRAYPLLTGEVLLTSFWAANTPGGEIGTQDVNWSGIYDPATGVIRETASPPGGRYMTVLPLADGRVLFIGSRDGSSVVELFR